MDEVVEIKGRIEEVRKEDRFTVIKVNAGGKEITAFGHLFYINPGEEVHLKGRWIGERLKIIDYRKIKKASSEGIKGYLGSVKGIGPVMAEKIVKRFGEETLDVIESDVERLKEVEGIGEKRVSMIKSSWESQRGIRDLVIFLKEHGISSTYAKRIYRQYGKRSIEVIKQNPYRLAMDIYGIGFITADRIAQKLGFSKDSEIRIMSGIIYILQQVADEGHVYLPYDELFERCKKILDVKKEAVDFALKRLELEGRIIKEEDSVYLSKLYVSEIGVAKRLLKILEIPKSIRKIDTEKAIEWVQPRLSIRLSEGQKQAIRAVSENKVVIITGGPGTGKTTTITAIIKIFSKIGAKILLAAPTGRASKRMQEISGFPAQTIHRLLEYSPERDEFRRNEKSPLLCDILVVDEVSMVDIILMYHLLKAVPPSATLILVGDVNQLPSVGPGSVLRDVINSGKFPVIELRHIFRQARKSLIVVNAHRINNGEFPIIRSKDTDFLFIEEEDPEKGLSIILDLVSKKLPERFGFDPVMDIQVISPMNKGVIGAENLNEKLQQLLNPEKEEIIKGGKRFKINDKVMQIRNNYEKNVFNGDIGRIVKIDRERQEIHVEFDVGRVVYDFSELDELTLSYAISVHKAQGSEYKAVVIPIFIQHYVLLQRNLIYTAITRGKRLVVIVGTKKALIIGIKNNKIQKRYTKLEKRLLNLI